MSLISNRLVGIVASTALLSLFAQTAHAQIPFDALVTGNVSGQQNGTKSSYKFTDSMILNSIAFATNGSSNLSLSYKVNGAISGSGYIPVNISSLGTTDSKGFQWFNLASGLTMQTNDILYVQIDGGTTGIADQTGVVSGSNVTFLGTINVANFPIEGKTNSNIRVTNPGSNVAPEPGSFALALTGGAALIGICIRRRRNAG
jgi:hypothetical protein